MGLLMSVIDVIMRFYDDKNEEHRTRHSQSQTRIDRIIIQNQQISIEIWHFDAKSLVSVPFSVA